MGTFLQISRFCTKKLLFSEKNSKRNILSAEGREVRGAFYSFNKVCDFFITGLLRFSWIFLDNKRSLPKGVRDYLGVRERGMNTLFSLYFFAAKSKYQTELVTKEVN